MTIDQAVVPLRMIFWGGLLCLLPSAGPVTAGSGFTAGLAFDVTRNAAGLILIIVGVQRLSVIPRSARYTTWMRIVKWLAVVTAVRVTWGRLFLPWPTTTFYAWSLLTLALAGMILFALGMRELALGADLTASAKSWRVNRNLQLGIWGTFYLIGYGPELLTWALGATPDIFGYLLRQWSQFATRYLGEEVLLVALIAPLLVYVPMIHFYMSIWRTLSEITSQSATELTELDEELIARGSIAQSGRS